MEKSSTRDQILLAARHLFLTQGYNATGMRDVAKAAEIRAVSGIYNHFPNKEAIFEALIVEHNPSSEVIPILQAVEGDTAPEFLRSFMRAALPLFVRHYDFFELVQIDAREFQGKHIAKVLEETILPHFLSILRKLQVLPGFRSLEPLVLFRLVGSAFIGYMMTQQIAPQSLLALLSEEEWIDRFADMLLHGLVADSDTEQEHKGGMS